jgi:hypothetical protein
MAKEKKDPRVDKRKVTMTSVFAGPVVDGVIATERQQAVDYVRPDHLEAFLADARTRWQQVEVSDEPDAGPGGYDGATHVPAHLPLPDAGRTYEATNGAE